MILSDALILPVSQLQRKQLMTSLIRWRIIFLCSCCGRNWWKI